MLPARLVQRITADEVEIWQQTRRFAARLEFPACPAKNKLPDSTPGQGIMNGRTIRLGNADHAAGPAAAGPYQPDRLGGICRALRPQDLRLVPQVEPPGGGRPGCHAERAAQAGPEAP